MWVTCVQLMFPSSISTLRTNSGCFTLSANCWLMLCCAVLCCVVLHCAALCGVVLCGVVLFLIVLCHVACHSTFLGWGCKWWFLSMPQHAAEGLSFDTAESLSSDTAWVSFVYYDSAFHFSFHILCKIFQLLFSRPNQYHEHHHFTNYQLDGPNLTRGMLCTQCTHSADFCMLATT